MILSMNIKIVDLNKRTIVVLLLFLFDCIGSLEQG